MPGNQNMCVSTRAFGIQHPYAYCVKPSDEMVPDQMTQGGLTMENTEHVLGGLLNYVDYLTLDADSATADICKQQNDDGSVGRGLIGNRYMLQTDIKCRILTETGVSGEAYLHKYMDNATTIGGMLTGGRPSNDVTGLIPSTFASSGKIGGSVLDIIGAFTGDTKPYCMPVSLKCHVIDSRDSGNNFKGYTPYVHLTLDDVRDLDVSLFVNQTKPPIPIPPSNESFTNFYNSNNIINENIIYQNMDKIQQVSEFNSEIHPVNFQDEFLIKTYYIGFSIFIIILIFKLLNKK